MKFRVRPLLFALALGIIANLSVVSVLSWPTNLTTKGVRGKVNAADAMRILRLHNVSPEDVNVSASSSQSMRFFGVTVQTVHARPRLPSDQSDYVFVGVREVGLPLRCVYEGGAYMRAGPYGIYWPAFAVNTLFFAAIVWLVLHGVPLARFVRGHRRIRRNVCVSCGYDLRGLASDSTTCPECGVSLLQRSRSSAP
jgi:hypothetical protein